MSYHAFISYSHAADGKLAPALQSGLQKLAKPFYRLRVLRVFRDETSLQLTPKLWPLIHQALSQSEHFVLMASPGAAASKWVQDEIDAWLMLHESVPDNLHIVLTEGEIAWDDAIDDFDWTRTTALPQNLRKKYQAEPLFLDFRWARESELLSVRNPQFLRAVGKLASAIRNQPLDSLVGEDVKQHRVFKVVSGVAIMLLSFLLVAATGAAFYANVQRKEAERQTEEANTQRQSALEAAQKERTAAENEKVARANEVEQRKRAESASENEKKARQQAEVRRRDAELKSKIALARQVAAQAQQTSSQYAYLLERSTLLAVESMRRYPTLDAQQVLQLGMTLIPPLVTTLRGDSETSASILSPDARYLALVNPSGINIYLLNSRQQIRFFETPYPRQVHFSADGKYLSAVADDTVIIRDLMSNEEVARLKCGSRVTVALMSPDNRYIAAGREDGITRVFEISSQREVARVEHSGRVTAVGFSPDGKYLASAVSDGWHAEGIGEIEIRQVETRQAVTHIKTEGRIDAMTFTSDGEYLLTARAEVFHAPRDYSGTILGHTVQRWDPSTGSNVAEKRYTDSYLMTFSPNGRFIAVAMKDRTFRVFSAFGDDEVARLENGATEVGLSDNGVIAISFSADAKYVAVVNGRGVTKMYDLQNERKTLGSQHSDSTAFHNGQRIIGSSSDRKYLAIQDSDNTVQIIEASSQRQIGRYHHEKPVTAIAFSANGQYLATASLDHSTRIWKINNGRELARKTHENKIRLLVFSPDGTLLATQIEPYTAVIWRVSDGREITRLVCDHGPAAMDPGISAMTFSPDGKYMATVDTSHARVWDVTRGQEVARLRNNQYSHTLAFSPDARSLFISGSEGSQRWVWQAGDLILSACGRLTRNLTLAEWRQYIGAEQYRKTCPNLP